MLLKHTFHNLATGKLSDIAGLWLLGLLGVAAAPQRPHVAAFCICIAFITWKSPFAQPFIDAWNLSGLPTTWREPDPTDLFTLVAVPIAVVYGRRRSCVRAGGRPHWRLVRTAVLSVLALLSFAATQRVGDHVCCGGALTAPFAKDVLFSQLEKAGAKDLSRTRELSNERGEWFNFALPDSMCGERVHVNVRLSEQKGQTIITTQYILYNCPRENDAAVQERYESFMKKVVPTA